MDRFARLPASDRREIIQERATQMDVDFTIVEKDFWVCWSLKSLFDLPSGNATMTFKGETSLSKAYGLIERFSEDIDVVTDPQFSLRKVSPIRTSLVSAKQGARSACIYSMKPAPITSRIAC